MKLYNNRILVIAYKHWQVDPRIIREIAALVDDGYQVDYLCTRRPEEHKTVPERDGVRFYTIPLKKKRQSILRYMFEYAVFCLTVFSYVSGLFLKNRYKIILPFVMPEFLALNCIIPKLFGAKILMDWEDPSREVFLAKFGHERNKIFLFSINIFEKCAVALANVIITPNEGFRRAFAARGHDRAKIHIVMNAPDRNIFNDQAAVEIAPDRDRFIILFNGCILRRHGLDIMIRAMELIVKEIPSACFQVVGRGEEDFEEECRRLTNELGLQQHVEFTGLVYITQMPAFLRRAHIGVVPNRNDDFTRINFPQRILELGLFKRPVVVPCLAGIQDYVDDSSVCFFEAENHADLAEKIIDLYKSPGKRELLIENAYRVANELKWKEPFLKIVHKMSEA